MAKLCLTLCDSMVCSIPIFPILYCLLEFVQTHVHWVDDAIQPSHSRSLPSLALSLSQDQGLFKWVISLHQVSKVLGMIVCLFKMTAFGRGKEMKQRLIKKKIHLYNTFVHWYNIFKVLMFFPVHFSVCYSLALGVLPVWGVKGPEWLDMTLSNSESV